MLYDIDKFNLNLDNQYNIFLNRKIQLYYHNRFKNGIFKPLKLNHQDEIFDFLTSLLKTKSGKWEDLIFITISPPDNTDTHSFVDKCLYLANLKIFTGYMVVFEQRGSTNMDLGKGIHCHLLLTRNHTYNKGKIKSRFLKSLKNQNIYNNKQNNVINLEKQMKKKQSYFSFQFPFNDKLLGKVDYLLGGKNDEKLDKVLCDKIWRGKYAISSHYYKESPFLKEKKILEYIIKNGS